VQSSRRRFIVPHASRAASTCKLAASAFASARSFWAIEQHNISVLQGSDVRQAQQPNSRLQPAASMPPLPRAEADAAPHIDLWRHLAPKAARPSQPKSMQGRCEEHRTSDMASGLSLSSSQTSEAARTLTGRSTSGGPRRGLSPLTMALASGHEGRYGRQDGLAVFDHFRGINVRSSPPLNQLRTARL
jgi:hypothetical protein